MKDLVTTSWETGLPTDYDAKDLSRVMAGRELPGDIVTLAQDRYPRTAAGSRLPDATQVFFSHQNRTIRKVHVVVLEEEGGDLAIMNTHFEFEGIDGQFHRDEFCDPRDELRSFGFLYPKDGRVWFVPAPGVHMAKRDETLYEPIELVGIERSARSDLFGSYLMTEDAGANERDSDRLRDFDPRWMYVIIRYNEDSAVLHDVDLYLDGPNVELTADAMALVDDMHAGPRL